MMRIFFDQNENHFFIEQKESKDGNRTVLFLQKRLIQLLIFV